MTTCAVLTEDRWRRLKEDRLSAEESALLQSHLETDCEACNSFFETMDEISELGLRELLKSLTALKPTTQFEEKAELDKILRRVLEADAQPEKPKVSGSNSFPWNRVIQWASAAAAVLAVTVGLDLFWDSSRPPNQTEKGPAESIPGIEIEFAIAKPSGDGHPTPNRGIQGAAYSESEFIILRFRANSDGYVYLLRYQPGRETKVLFEDQLGGPMENTVGPFPLTGIRGRNFIFAVISDRPLALETQLVPIAQKTVSLSDKKGPPLNLVRRAEGLSVDGIYFDVEPDS